MFESRTGNSGCDWVSCGRNTGQLDLSMNTQKHCFVVVVGL